LAHIIALLRQPHALKVNCRQAQANMFNRHLTQNRKKASDSMTHEDAGHYAAKHARATANPGIAAQLKKQIAAGGISCRAAHAAASLLQVTPREVGITIDLLEARIVQCQLGLFGWSKQETSGEPACGVAESMRLAIEAALVDGRLPCAAAWKIAESLAVAKRTVKDACDRMNIKICRCQLGAFS
jgi:hypothetical protein